MLKISGSGLIEIRIGIRERNLCEAPTVVGHLADFVNILNKLDFTPVFHSWAVWINPGTNLVTEKEEMVGKPFNKNSC
jgi:hypothetical protein